MHSIVHLFFKLVSDQYPCSLLLLMNERVQVACIYISQMPGRYVRVLGSQPFEKNVILIFSSYDLWNKKREYSSHG